MASMASYMCRKVEGIVEPRISLSSTARLGGVGISEAEYSSKRVMDILPQYMPFIGQVLVLDTAAR
jgi:hypothetical protein